MFCTCVNDIVPLNYTNKLEEIQQVLNSWSRGNLTPFGKMAVIKTLAVSKLTHLSMYLPDPNEQFLVD